MKSLLQGNNIEMYSTHNEGKSTATERFIRTLKIKIYKYMTSVSKIAFIRKKDDIVNKYNKTYHITIKIRPADVKSSTYIDFNSENNKEGPKFKINDNVIISKYNFFFANGCFRNWSEEVFAIKKVTITVSWTYIIRDFNDEEVVGKFCKK